MSGDGPAGPRLDAAAAPGAEARGLEPSAERGARRRVLAAGLAALALAFAAPVLAPGLAAWTRATGFDLLQGVSPAETGPSQAAAVAIGERSLAALGPWPWPRARLAALVEAVAAGRPRAVALAILLDAAGPYSAEALARDAPDLLADPATRAALAGEGPSDARLARAFAAAPTALATALRGSDEGDTPADARAPAALPLVGGAARGPTYPGLVAPRPALAAAAASAGSINMLPDRDMLLRRAPLVFLVNGAAHPSLAVAAMGAAGLEPALEVAGGRPEALAFAGGRVAVETSGAVWLDFGRRGAIETVEAADLMSGAIPAARLRDRIVVIGVDAPGAAAPIRTADRALTAAPLAHALVVDALLSGGALSRRALAPALEALWLLAAGAATAALWAARSPAVATAASFALPTIWAAAAFAARAETGLLLDPLTPTLGLWLAAAVSAAARSMEDERRRRRLVAALAAGKRAAERDERARSAYLAQLSHELRSPVNAVHGAAREISSLAIRADLAGVLENVHRIEELSGQMRALIAKSVSAAEEDAATPPIELERVDLARALDAAVDLAKLAAAKAYSEARVIRELSPAPVKADRVYLVNALVCLVSNAIAYAGFDGPILCRAGVGQDGLCFAEVLDSGRGVTEEVLRAAETPLPSRALLAAAPGVYGLGLFAAKGMAELNGGRLELGNRPEGGVVARIALPREGGDA